jgi:LmbE family N-acetylglucosaminyl deacetylase
VRPLTLPPVSHLVAIAAHPDDVEIAAGGLLLTLAELPRPVRVTYALVTGEPDRVAELRTAIAAFLPDCDVSLLTASLTDTRLPAQWDELKSFLAMVAEAAGDPDLVLAPAPHDAHQDHRLIAEMVPTVFRDALVLHYEIPKWDGDFGRPSLYLPISDQIARRKVELLNACFPSQKARDWWDDEVFLGLARLRGMECRSRYAEAFWTPKARLGLR